ncbi:MAG: hypothetical protein MJ181_00185 [Treponema sp.]|nr:hypothetical protein [Treponema sp.]
MNFKITLIIITYILLIADVLSAIPRSKKIMSRAGKLILPVKNRSKIFFMGNYLWALFLPFILLIRDFRPAYEIIFCLVSVAGAEMNTRDFITKGQYGIYENCVIANGVTVFFDDIVTFPILNLPEEEQEKYDHSNLVVATKSRGNENLIFSSPEECKKATELIRNLSKK